MGRPTSRASVDVVETPSTHCWEWQGQISSEGYGRYGLEYAHRLFYEDFVGPIAEGLCIDHLCRNRVCVNPGHLEAVTFAENLRRGEGFGGQNARKTHCLRGHALDGPTAYVNYRGQRVCRICQRIRNARRDRRKAAA